jgi:outer membrane receptor protein involved in Fe transport
LTGLFYSNYQFNLDTGSIAPSALILTSGATDQLFKALTTNAIKQKAWFGNVNFQSTAKLKLTAGLRYFSYDSGFNSASSGFAYTGTSIPNLASSAARNSGFNPMLNISYTLTDDAMVYATAAKGFREGAANFPIPNDPSTTVGAQCLASLESIGRTSAPLSFGPDSVWSYELGAKSKWLDQKVVFNADVYDLRWSKVQQAVSLSCGLAFTDNASSAEVKGGEMEMEIKLLPAVRLSQSVGYAHAVFTSNSLEANITAGQDLLDAPRWTVSTALDYTLDLNDKNTLLFRVSNSYVSSSQDLTYALNTIPSRDLTNARISWQTGRYTAALFVNNMLNKHTILTYENSLTANSPSFNRAGSNQPMTVGLDVNYNF